MKFIVAVVLVVVVLAWIGGEQHRGDCIDQGRSGCSILPWDNGHKANPNTELQRLQRKYGLEP